MMMNVSKKTFALISVTIPLGVTPAPALLAFCCTRMDQPVLMLMNVHNLEGVQRKKTVSIQSALSNAYLLVSWVINEKRMN